MGGQHGNNTQTWGIYRYDAEENVVYLFDSYTDYLEAEAFRLTAMIDLALSGYAAADDDVGDLAGAGHCVLITGYNDDLQMFEYRNSWGPTKNAQGKLEGYWGRWTTKKLDEKDEWDEPYIDPHGDKIPGKIEKGMRFSTRNNCPHIHPQWLIDAFPQFNHITSSIFNINERLCDETKTSFCGYGLMSYQFLQYSPDWIEDKPGTYKKGKAIVIK